MNHNEIVSFIWGVADLIRDTFKRGKYQDVILPLTVLRRLDCVLAPTKAAVLEANNKYGSKVEDLNNLLRSRSGLAFWNTSRYDFESLLGDAGNLAANLRNYIAGFSPNMREVLEKFDFDNTITKLEDSGLLFQVVERFKNLDLHPDEVDNHTMGTIFEELIRKFNEALNENPGEHFTPRDVVNLMADLLLCGDEQRISKPNITLTLCDPCCGSGGMLTIAKNHILGTETKEGLNPKADIWLYGQEVNPETFALCKSDLFMKDPTGRDADNILYGSTLKKDGHKGQAFDYLIANPPYGKDWKGDKDKVQEEYQRGYAGRFGAGLPRISDGQLLFLQHMISHMQPKDQGGTRIAIIMNGSPLFTGDAGSGESEIRRWILENDWLECLVALPEQLFYNTGIGTYIWILSNRKRLERKGKVLLIDAKSFWEPMKRSLGDKRREIPATRAQEIKQILENFEEGEHSKIFPITHFGYRKITVERPLRLNFQASPERLERLKTETAFINLAVSKKKDPAVKQQEEETGKKKQQEILEFLGSLPQDLFMDKREFEKVLTKKAREADIKIPAALKKAVLSALSQKDDNAAVCLDKDGFPEPDPELRDTESIPLPEGIDPVDEEGITKSVQDFFEREVVPHVPDAWINTTVRDHKDRLVGKIGYEINFNRYFYKYVPPRPLEEIESDFREVEAEIAVLLEEMTR